MNHRKMVKLCWRILPFSPINLASNNIKFKLYDIQFSNMPRNRKIFNNSENQQIILDPEITQIKLLDKAIIAVIKKDFKVK